MDLRVEHLPKIAGKTTRVYGLRRLAKFSNPSFVRLREGLSMAEVSKRTGIREPELERFGITKEGVNVNVLLKHGNERALLELNINMREGEIREAEHLAAIIAGRIGREEDILQLDGSAVARVAIELHPDNPEEVAKYLAGEPFEQVKGELMPWGSVAARLGNENPRYSGEVMGLIAKKYFHNLPDNRMVAPQRWLTWLTDLSAHVFCKSSPFRDEWDKLPFREDFILGAASRFYSDHQFSKLERSLDQMVSTVGFLRENEGEGDIPVIVLDEKDQLAREAIALNQMPLLKMGFAASNLRYLANLGVGIGFGLLRLFRLPGNLDAIARFLLCEDISKFGLESRLDEMRSLLNKELEERGYVETEEDSTRFLVDSRDRNICIWFISGKINDKINEEKIHNAGEAESLGVSHILNMGGYYNPGRWS